MDKPVFGVEEITGKFVLADKVHLLGYELEVQERDKRNDHTSVFKLYDQEDKPYVINSSPTNQVVDGGYMEV